MGVDGVERKGRAGVEGRETGQMNSVLCLLAVQMLWLHWKEGNMYMYMLPWIRVHTIQHVHMYILPWIRVHTCTCASLDCNTTCTHVV